MAKEVLVKMASTETLTEKNFEKRECIRIVPIMKQTDRCKCGRKVSDHRYAAGPDATRSAALWSISRDTKSFATDAYGYVEFHGGPHPHKAHFLRLSSDSKPQSVLRLLEERWKLGRPKLVISIYGNARDNFDLNSKLEKVFSTGLVKTIKTTDAWIICSGLDSGVSKYVAKAFASAATRRVKRKAVMIGIAPWGMLKNRDDFLLKKGDSASGGGQMAANAADGIIVPYYSRDGSHETLCPVFTHFLLVDDGTTHRFGAEMVLRQRLEEYIRQQILLKANQQHVPVVVVLLNGGVSTLRRVLDCVTNKPALPVVVIGGSGGVANHLAIADKPENLKSQIFASIPRDVIHRSASNAIFETVMLCARCKEHISIFRLGETRQEFDSAILATYLNAQHHKSVAKRLALTLTWNRADVASEYVFSRAELSIADLEKNMMEALVNDRIDFVQLLLNNGVSMEKFLTVDRLEELYNKSDKAATLLAAMEDVVRRARYAGYRYTLPNIGVVMRRLMGGIYDASGYLKRTLSHLPFNDLFVWAVLTKRHSMAMFMWRNGDEPLAKALVAITLTKSLSKEAASSPNADEICVEFDSYADAFRSESLQLLSQCNSMNDDVTLQLLTRELDNWGHETCISLAVRASHKDFVAHPACQMLLNDLWQGGLQLRKRFNQLVLLAMLFPPAMYFMDFKTKEELQMQAQRAEEVKSATSDTDTQTKFRAPVPEHGGTQLRLIDKIYEFYAAPITKFWVWTVGYLIFLGVYTHFVLLQTPEMFDDWREWYIVSYAVVQGIDFMREILMSEPKHLRHKLLVFIRRRWNLTLSLAVLMLLTATALRGMDDMIDVTRLVYICNIVIWYTRVLDIIGIHSLLGPYIIMFGQTVLSFLSLSTIFAVLLTSYGVTAHSIRYQDQGNWTWHFVRDTVSTVFHDVRRTVRAHDRPVRRYRRRLRGWSLGESHLAVDLPYAHEYAAPEFIDRHVHKYLHVGQCEFTNDLEVLPLQSHHRVRAKAVVAAAVDHDQSFRVFRALHRVPLFPLRRSPCFRSGPQVSFEQPANTLLIEFREASYDRDECGKAARDVKFARSVFD